MCIVGSKYNYSYKVNHVTLQTRCTCMHFVDMDCRHCTVCYCHDGVESSVSVIVVCDVAHTGVLIHMLIAP